MQFGTQAGVATRHGTSITAKVFADARANGCKLVNFDPHMSGAAEKADEWVPIRPGTDAAVALAMANLLVNEYDLYDKEFLAARTNGPSLVDPATQRIVRDASKGNKALYWDLSDNTAKPYDEVKEPALEGDFEVDGIPVRTAFSIFKDSVAKYTPEYAEEVTTIPADTTRRLAKEFGEAACIGQTVEVDGLTVPYRPVAVDTFSGIARHKHGFITHWAILQLNTLVGSTFSRGGYLGFYTRNKYGFYEGDKDHAWEFTIWEEDGLIEDLNMAHGWPSNGSHYKHIREASYTPTSEAMEELQPLTMDQHFGYIAQVQPEVYGTEPSEVAFCMASNPLKNWCNHDYQAKVLESFDWIFGMDIYLNDSSYYYDLIIPEPCYRERFDPLPLSFNNHRVPGLPEVPYIVAGRMPIVEAKDNCPSALDTFGALAAKAGKTAEYSAALNDYYKLADEYKLDGKEQITAERVCDAALKSLAGKDRGIDWFRENGVLTRERKPTRCTCSRRAWKGASRCTSTSCLKRRRRSRPRLTSWASTGRRTITSRCPNSCRASTTRWRRKASTCSPCTGRTPSTPIPGRWRTPGSTRSTSWTIPRTSWRSTRRPVPPRASNRVTRCACRTATAMWWKAWPCSPSSCIPNAWRRWAAI